MLEDFSKKIQDNIKQDMKDKFGLSEKESQQSLSILLKQLKKRFSQLSLKGNIQDIKQLIQEKISEKGSPLKDTFSQETIQELMTKVGLSEETAKKVKDFSLEQYRDQMKSSIAAIEQKFDIDSIIDKLKPDSLEQNTKELKDNIEKLFKKK